MGERKFRNSYLAPNDLHLIVENPYQAMVLQYLCQLSNGYHRVHPSQEKMRLGVMSRPKVHTSLKYLISRKFIEKHKRPLPLSSEYSVNYDVINNEILKALSSEELGKRAKRELSEKGKDEFATRRVLAKPELTQKVKDMASDNE